MRALNNTLLVAIVILVILELFFSEWLTGFADDLHTVLLAVTVVTSVIVEILIRKKFKNEN